MQSTSLPPTLKAEWLVMRFKKINEENIDYTDDHAISEAVQHCNEMIDASVANPALIAYWTQVKNAVANFS